MTQRTQLRAAELAAQLETVNDAVLDALAACTASQWQQATESEGWPVGIVAHHMSQVQKFAAGALAGLPASETSLAALTSHSVDENNARHAIEFAGVGKPETLAALRENGAALVGVIRALDDEQLAHSALTFDGHELSGEQVVEQALIGHFHEHLNSIRATLGA